MGHAGRTPCLGLLLVTLVNGGGSGGSGGSGSCGSLQEIFGEAPQREDDTWPPWPPWPERRKWTKSTYFSTISTHARYISWYFYIEPEVDPGSSGFQLSLAYFHLWTSPRGCICRIWGVASLDGRASGTCLASGDRGHQPSSWVKLGQVMWGWVKTLSPWWTSK